MTLHPSIPQRLARGLALSLVASLLVSGEARAGGQGELVLIAGPLGAREWREIGALSPAHRTGPALRLRVAPAEASDPELTRDLDSTDEPRTAEAAGAGRWRTIEFPRAKRLGESEAETPRKSRPALDDEGRATAERLDPRSLELMAALARAPLVWLDGGEFLDWWELTNERDHETRLRVALLDAWRDGATLVGSSGGAAWLAGSSRQAGDQYEWKEANPRRRDRDEFAVGDAGLVPLHLEIAGVVTGGGRPGSLERLGEAVRERRLQAAALLAGPVAWIYDPSRERGRVLGAGAVVWIETRGSRRSRTWARDLTLALLSDGDGWDCARGRGLRPEIDAGVNSKSSKPPSVTAESDADGLDRLRRQLEELARDSRESAVRWRIAPLDPVTGPAGTAAGALPPHLWRLDLEADPIGPEALR